MLIKDSLAILPILAVALSTLAWGAVITGTATGSVLDDTGKPISGAHVSINRTAAAGQTHAVAPPVITGPLVATAVADSRGAFSVPNLPPGQYVVCAQSATPGYLDPCHWATSAPIFTISPAGQPVAGVHIVMAKGAVLSVHLDDPLGLLNSRIGLIDSELQIHVVTAKGMHHPLLIQGRTSVSREQAVTVPFGAGVTVQIFAPHFVVNSGGQSALRATSVTVPPGNSPPPIILAVGGRK